MKRLVTEVISLFVVFIIGIGIGNTKVKKNYEYIPVTYSYPLKETVVVKETVQSLAIKEATVVVPETVVVEQTVVVEVPIVKEVVRQVVNTPVPLVQEIISTETPVPVAIEMPPTEVPVVDSPVSGSSYPCIDGQIKGNRNSGIYHVPSGQFYAITKANVVCFNSEQEALNAGFRKAKR